jgi:uncharacterized protein YecA (UPF0149 family)
MQESGPDGETSAAPARRGGAATATAAAPPAATTATATVAGKVGRNDPCPCGSGKKYKKCHGGGAV